jgi:hypothetical protein
MASVWVHFSPEFLHGAGFSREQSQHSWPRGKHPVFRGVNRSSLVLELRRSNFLRTPLEQPHFTLRRWRSGEELLWSFRTTLENLLLREIQDWSASGQTTFLKSLIWKRTLNKKYMWSGNALNVRYIQQKHQWASPMSWDCPFKMYFFTILSEKVHIIYIKRDHYIIWMLFCTFLFFDSVHFWIRSYWSNGRL